MRKNAQKRAKTRHVAQRHATPHSIPLLSANPKEYQNGWFPKWQVLGGIKNRHTLVPIYFGTHLGVPLAAPKGVSKQMVFKVMGSLNFEN